MSSPQDSAGNLSEALTRYSSSKPAPSDASNQPAQLQDLMANSSSSERMVRDTQIADSIRRGVSSFLTKGLNAVSLPEFSLKNDRRADIMALLPDGSFWLIEIKSGKQDFQSDTKWLEYLDFCDWYSFAVAPEFPLDILPQNEGLLIADAYGAEIARAAQNRKMSAARRKAVTTRFARTAAKRLEMLSAGL